MRLINSSIWNGVAVAVKMLTLMGINKVLAIYVGPSGYAVIGQFQNIISTCLVAANAGITGGVVKYTAEYETSPELRLRIWRTALVFSFISTMFVSLLVFFLSDYLAKEYLMQESYGMILRWFSIFLFFIVFNNIFMAIINGHKNIRDYVKISILSSLFSMIYTSILVYFFSLTGALLALVSNQAIICLLAFYVGKKKGYFNLRQLLGLGDFSSLKKLSKFSLMILIPSIIWPITYTYVRQLLVQDLGTDFAGGWDAMHKLSNIYLSFLTTVISVYALPKISSLTSMNHVTREVLNIYKLIIPAALVLCGSIFYFRREIINILFTDEFYIMLDLFKWQVAGDYLKILAWVLSYTIMARAMVYKFIFIEFSSIATYIIIVTFCIPKFGFEGVSIAHFLNNFIFLALAVLVYLLTHFCDKNKNKKVIE
jgi:PST family polysaccharide transporter